MSLHRDLQLKAEASDMELFHSELRATNAKFLGHPTTFCVVVYVLLGVFDFFAPLSWLIFLPIGVAIYRLQRTGRTLGNIKFLRHGWCCNYRFVWFHLRAFF